MQSSEMGWESSWRCYRSMKQVLSQRIRYSSSSLVRRHFLLEKEHGINMYDDITTCQIRQRTDNEIVPEDWSHEKRKQDIATPL